MANQWLNGSTVSNESESKMAFLTWKVAKILREFNEQWTDSIAQRMSNRGRPVAYKHKSKRKL